MGEILPIIYPINNGKPAIIIVQHYLHHSLYGKPAITTVPTSFALWPESPVCARPPHKDGCPWKKRRV